MVPPQMPRGRSVRQTIFHHQPNRRVNHPVRVVALGRGQVLHIRVEVTTASQAMVLGVRDLNIPRSAGNRVAKLVKSTNDRTQAIGTPPALRTRPTSVVPTSLTDLGLGQVLHPNDALGHIRNVPSWPGHGDILHESPSKKLSAR
jgi:hypothetical protein